jgi:hypothetical protein
VPPRAIEVKRRYNMAAERISAEQAHVDVESGRALLVCAYDSDEKYRANCLPDAMSLAGFRAQEDAIPKGKELIFYCG